MSQLQDEEKKSESDTSKSELMGVNKIRYLFYE
jgi:hypothetical protein